MFISILMIFNRLVVYKKTANFIIGSIAGSEIEEKYASMLFEMFLNIIVFLIIIFIGPLFLEVGTLKGLLVSYYIASIIWGFIHAIPIMICSIQNLLSPGDILGCLIERESGFFASFFFEGTIKEAIIPTILYMIVASVIYVVLFRYLALPYFVEDLTGMGILDLVISSVYLPIKEWFSMIYDFVI